MIPDFETIRYLWRDENDRGKCRRLLIIIRGLVQGVGFRPFVFRLANDLGLHGWVCNSSSGVSIELEGAMSVIAKFMDRLDWEKPPHSRIDRIEAMALPAAGYKRFEVRKSTNSGDKEAMVLPDLAICPDCLAEIMDPQNRRYRYPFTNCTNCGPRYSIVESLPYDRAATTMKSFEMCDECRAEYEDPNDRRFHAQPNACPQCGPRLELWDEQGKVLCSGDRALRESEEVIREGKILAIKGLGGFQLLVDARNDKAVERLRRRKAREEKPLALMYPDLKEIISDCEIGASEETLLVSPQAPIVLVKRRDVKGERPSRISSLVAPHNSRLGIMLPNTPLHYLLIYDLGFPVVATSGNLSHEPICIDEREALERLRGIADMFLVHNRPVARPVDDSVVQSINGQLQVVRNARGYAPHYIDIEGNGLQALAVGAHLSNTVAIAVNDRIILSQHIGDLDTPGSRQVMKSTVRNLAGIYGCRPKRASCDLHADYGSTAYAESLGLPIRRTQHHQAHILSCMVENKLEGPVLGVAWDGTGLGTDGTVWGGEFLKVDNNGFERSSHLRTFMLPGGEKAVREPMRSAVGVLYECFGKSCFERRDLMPIRKLKPASSEILKRMLVRRTNCPITSSAGRLFDAVSSLTGLCHFNSYSGQAAMILEGEAAKAETDDLYRFTIHKSDGKYILDWKPMVIDIVGELKKGLAVSYIAAKFHNTLAEMILEAAKKFGEEKIVLSGGCFQNKYLSESVISKLEKSGFKVFYHHRIPPNDGGISVGQMISLLRDSEQGK